MSADAGAAKSVGTPFSAAQSAPSVGESWAAFSLGEDVVRRQDLNLHVFSTLGPKLSFADFLVLSRYRKWCLGWGFASRRVGG